MSKAVARLHMPHLKSTEVLIQQFCRDPFALTSDERLTLHRELHPEQRRWLPKLRAFVEPPTPDATFPAFLLALPTFAHLANAIGAGQSKAQVGTGILDELQRFADHYRGWLEGDARHDEIWDTRNYARSA